MGFEPSEPDIEGGNWVSIEILTERQEEFVRKIAEDWGFKDLAGLAGYLSSHDWNYYDAFKASCRE
jgi:hypothetical protein